MRHTLLMLAAIIIAAPAVAAEVVKLADNGAPPKRFMTLDNARRGDVAKVRTPAKSSAKTTAKSAMSSDMQQMRDGFMRIDRARANPSRTGLSATTKAPAAEVEAVRVIERPSASAAVTAIPSVPLVVDVEEALKDEEEIEGNADKAMDPVLSLFDAGSDAGPTTFREALSGRTGSMIAGVGRHLVWPVPLHISQKFTSGYGTRKDPLHGGKAFHGGIDIAAPTGTPVLATADGEVTQVASDARYGKYISIRHPDGTTSRYGHLSAQRVSVGQRVRGGQAIGAIGSTGRSTGPHLDYRISKDGTKFDPLTVLNMPASVVMANGGDIKGAVSPVRVSAVERPMRFMQMPKRQPLVIKVR